MLMNLVRFLLKFIKKEPAISLRIANFRNFAVAYRKGSVDEDILRESFDNDVYFSGVHEYKPAENHVIIDVGAHIGAFSLLAASKVKTGKVYAIEASRESFDFLRINIALNRLNNVKAFHLALMDTEGLCKLYGGSNNWSHSTVMNRFGVSESVRCCTLETFLKRNSIENCHFMKLNCEGAEFPIILNSSANVLQHFEKLLILFHCDFWTANSELDLVAHLQSCGFTTTVRNRSEKRGWIIAVNNIEKEGSV